MGTSSSVPKRSFNSRGLQTGMDSVRVDLQTVPSVKQVNKVQKRKPQREFKQRSMVIGAEDSLQWPLPEKETRDPFEVLIPEPNRYKLTKRDASPIPFDDIEVVEASNPIAHQQQATSNNEWKIVDSQSDESAHVQSQLIARSEAHFNLSTSARVDVLMKSLKEVYKVLDDRVKQRLDEVTADADKILQLIIEDTNAQHDRLLQYDKEQQRLQSNQYQEWLQRYVVELNKWRSQELSDLQKELMTYQKTISDTSQEQIRILSSETNRIKLEILREEQNNSKAKTEGLTDKINELVSGENLQQLGSESKMELNLRIQANVGRMPPS